MTCPHSRRSALRTGGVALVSALAGCSAFDSGGDDTALDLRLENQLSNKHSLRIAFAPDSSEVESVEKTATLGPSETKTFENAVPYPEGELTVTAFGELDGQIRDERSGVLFSKQLARMTLVAKQVDYSLGVAWRTKKRSGGFF